MLNKKEGNITNSSPNLASQAGRQAGAHLPLGEGGSLSQAGSQASQAGAHLLPGEGSNLMAQATQAGR